MSDVSDAAALRLSDFDEATLSPMMRQYAKIKRKHADCILFYRLGDFYEMFFEDAATASRELEITLTSRDCGQDRRAPMCGVPYRAVDSYLPRLVQKGYKVAICEQTEDPATTKGLVKREVTRVVTPGTVTEPSILDEKTNSYLICIYYFKNDGSRADVGFSGNEDVGVEANSAAKMALPGSSSVGLCAADLSAGSIRVTSILWGDIDAKLTDEVAGYMPREIIANGAFFEREELVNAIRQRSGAFISRLANERFSFDETSSRVVGMTASEGCLDELQTRAAGAALGYLDETQKSGIGHMDRIDAYIVESFMALDASTRAHLEIVETMRERRRSGSLLGAVDKTATAAGGRLIRSWFSQPLTDIGAIAARHEAVAELERSYILREGLRRNLGGVADIERTISRVVMGGAGPAEYLALRLSLLRVPQIIEFAKSFASSKLAAAFGKLDGLEDIADLIGRSISENAPRSIREGDVIRDGFDDTVDSCRAAMRDGKSWIAALERRERDAHGIKTLKVGYNRVFGYYIEAPRSAASQIPSSYLRKQTLANCERYIFDELKELEDKILGAEERALARERELFSGVREKVAEAASRVRLTSEGLAELDTIAALAEVAANEGYCKPTMNTDGIIDIKEGRHPVVEKRLGRDNFVANDADLDMDAGRTVIITGPNMSGKSTYMRQIALICLMAQAGSFVPATSANLCVVDRIFTRVGASDDLSAGQSTFMSEMIEVAHIMANATPRSLIALDEIGRGTSTYDGLAIAWAVAEFVNDKRFVGAKTLFSTHYRELTELSGVLDGVRNLCVEATEKDGEVRFLHKVKPGGADASYGIYVAKLAGLPKVVIDRAKELLVKLEEADIGKRAGRKKRVTANVEGQFNMFEAVDAPKQEREVLDALRRLDLTRTTPFEAMNILYEAQKRLRTG